MIVVSTGCPAGVGPEVSVAAAASFRSAPVVLVGDYATLCAAADVVRVAKTRLVPLAKGATPKRRQIGILEVGPELSSNDRRPGKPSKRAGVAQLAYIDAAYDFARRAGAALVSGPVSKAAVAHSGARGASKFRGHTEWLQERDRAKHAIMCFAAPKLVTSLVTTHLPLSRVPGALTKESVCNSTVELVRLLHAVGKKRPVIAVASLNPHAGESELLGTEERKAIIPGIALARAAARRAKITGPIGAETAYRLMAKGAFDGVVAMYHDQATIPMKLAAFGDAVNITMGLSIVRTSVDHGTAYDIAWQGKADPAGMHAAMRMAEVLNR